MGSLTWTAVAVAMVSSPFFVSVFLIVSVSLSLSLFLSRLCSPSLSLHLSLSLSLFLSFINYDCLSLSLFPGQETLAKSGGEASLHLFAAVSGALEASQTPQIDDFRLALYLEAIWPDVFGSFFRLIFGQPYPKTF